MHTILDIDLDFFVWPIAHWREGSKRLPEKDYSVSQPTEVREFLERRCSLKQSEKIPGHEMVEHHDAFFTWRRWLKEGILSAPFDVVHVDAHADLGLGDSGWVYLLSELLALPIGQRSEPRFGPGAMNSGNYLAFSIANRWVAHLNYVFPSKLEGGRQEQICVDVCLEDKFSETVSLGGPATESRKLRPPDLMPLLFRNSDTNTNLIELRHYSPDIVRDLTVRKPRSAPIYTEPAVPFEWTPGDKFIFERFTHMTVAQSPQFTPASADRLLPLFREYFVEA